MNTCQSHDPNRRCADLTGDGTCSFCDTPTRPARTESYVVCDRCGVALTNNDYSAFDMHDMNEDEWCEIYAAVEAMGNAHRTGATVDGYSRCFVCSEDVIDADVWVAQ